MLSSSPLLGVILLLIVWTRVQAHVEPRPNLCHWVWRGNWSLGTLYARCDTVRSNHSLYVSTRWQRNGAAPHLSTSGSWELAVPGVGSGEGVPGANGLDGPDGQGFTQRAAWDASTTYAPFDVVLSGSSTYVAVSSSLNDEPPSAAWLLFAPGGGVGLGYTTQGTWLIGTTYHARDVVAYASSTYQALGTSTGAQPDISPSQWVLWAPKADKGDTGAAGLTYVMIGNWNSGTSYVPGNVVVDATHVYACTVADTNMEPVSDAPAHWVLFPIGPAGVQGVSFTWQAAWNSGSTYALYSIVTYIDGATYYCTTAVTTPGTAPPSDAGHWKVLLKPAAQGSGYGGTSTTSVTITDTLSRALTLDTSLHTFAYAAGMRVRASYTTDPINQYMEGVVTSYTGGVLTFTADNALGVGNGPYTAWSISLVGKVGTAGQNAADGATGAQGPGYGATSTSSNTLDTTSNPKIFVLASAPSYAYAVGDRVRATDTSVGQPSPPVQWIEGVVTLVSGTNLRFTADRVAGSGSSTSWTLSLAGSLGTQGVTGDTGAHYGATSTTPNTLGTGLKTFTLPSDSYAFAANQRVRVSDVTTTGVVPAQYMDGLVTAASSTSITVNVDTFVVVGGGSISHWTLTLIGDIGTKGVTGDQGSQGVTGDQGPVGNTGGQGAGFAGTSTSSVSIGAGSKTFVLTGPPSFAYTAGMYVRAADGNANPPTQWVEGTVTSFSGNTLVVSVVDRWAGSGTPVTTWYLSLVGKLGTQGTTGTAGAKYGATSSTSNAIGTGSTKTFTIPSASYAWIVGDRVRASDTTTPSVVPANYMEGVVTAVSSTSIAFSSDRAVGSGSPSSWAITLVGNKGTAGTNGGGGFLEVHVASDVEGAGAEGGSSTTTFTTRVLNTLVSYGGTSVTLSTNTLTLVAGTYFVQAHAPAVQANNHKIIMVDGSGTTVATGNSAYAISSQTNCGSDSWLFALITPASTTSYTIKHAVNASLATQGFGQHDSNSHSTAPNYPYTEVEIFRLA